MAMDANRYQDGIDLRKRFAYDNRLTLGKIRMLNEYACSVLEMMLALCIRCEEHILNDPEIGDRTSIWFKDMLKSMGLDQMDDTHFDEMEAEEIVDAMLYREYSSNGEGGLFTCERCPYDMRTLEIWYQAQWFFNEIV